MDNKKILDDLLNIYEDPEKDLILLMKDTLSSGILIKLNNETPNSLFNILHVNDWSNVSEYSCFLVFYQNYKQNYRKYCHKLLFFDDESHQYQITVHCRNGGKKIYTKNTNWKTFLKGIQVDSESLIEVQELSVGKCWNEVLKHSFLENECSYYNEIKDIFRNILKRSNKKNVKKFYKRFVKKDDFDVDVFLETFEPLNVSKNLLFLKVLQKELVDKKSVRKLNEIYDKLEQPIQEMSSFLKEGLIVNSSSKLPYHELIRKTIKYENKAQQLFNTMKVVIDDKSPLMFSYSKAVLFLLNLPEEFLMEEFRSWKSYDYFYDEYYDLINEGVLSKNLDDQLNIWAESLKFSTFVNYPKDRSTVGQVKGFILEMKKYQSFVRETFKNSELYGSEDVELEQTLKKIFNIDPNF